MTTVRGIIEAYQKEVQEKPDLDVPRAAIILNHLASLVGNCNSEIRTRKTTYNIKKRDIFFADADKKATTAKILSEATDEWNLLQEALDTKELTVELMRSLKYYLRSHNEWEAAGNMRV